MPRGIHNIGLHSLGLYTTVSGLPKLKFCPNTQILGPHDESFYMIDSANSIVMAIGVQYMEWSRLLAKAVTLYQFLYSD